MIVFGGRGGRGNEGMAQTDGIGTGAAINGGGVSGYGRLDTTEEVVMTTGAGLGEAEMGGPIVNLVPRLGGNTFQHRFQGLRHDGRLAKQQLLAELKAQGLLTPAKTNYLWDTSMMSGGPIRRDRMWFFLALRYDNGQARSGRRVFQQERWRSDEVELRP